MRRGLCTDIYIRVCNGAKKYALTSNEEQDIYMDPFLWGKPLRSMTNKERYLWLRGIAIEISSRGLARSSDPFVKEFWEAIKRLNQDITNLAYQTEERILHGPFNRQTLDEAQRLFTLKSDLRTLLRPVSDSVVKSCDAPDDSSSVAE